MTNADTEADPEILSEGRVIRIQCRSELPDRGRGRDPAVRKLLRCVQRFALRAPAGAMGVRYYAGLHYEKDGEREFVHSQTGGRTLKEEFDKVAAHNERHLRQIELALPDSKTKP